MLHNDTHQNALSIAVIGLGYVGLPVATAFAKYHTVIGYDKNKKRIAELKQGIDTTNAVDSECLSSNNMTYSSDSRLLKKANCYIVTVPTPIHASKQPDLSMLIEASTTIGHYLKHNDIVIYESTVYPGATEEVCMPTLEKASKLHCGKDFYLAYSPERINPGDKTHQLKTITKVVSAQDEKTLNTVADLYRRIIPAGVYCAPNIQTAEAAKVIENTQRDLNIAFMNELALIFNRMNIDTAEVLAAAGTKWNFMPFQPGLVGGHCIGVDPYYLTYKAEQYGYSPEVILAGRRINDNLGQYIANQTVKQMIQAGQAIKNAKVGILGLSFKENCSDLRNTKVIDIIHELESYGLQCQVHDPNANSEEAKALYGLELMSWTALNNLAALVYAVPHREFTRLTPEAFKTKFNTQPLIIDVKSVLDKSLYQNAGITLWRL